CSANGEPPGSRVRTGTMPLRESASASSRACVVLPEPSPPSKVMNRPDGMTRSRAASHPPVAGAVTPPSEAVGQAAPLVYPPGSQIEQRVKPSPYKAGRVHIFSGVERHLAGGFHRGGHPQHGDLLALP